MLAEPAERPIHGAASDQPFSQIEPIAIHPAREVGAIPGLLDNGLRFGLTAAQARSQRQVSVELTGPFFRRGSSEALRAATASCSSAGSRVWNQHSSCSSLRVT
jgi:hypothetical protein